MVSVASILKENDALYEQGLLLGIASSKAANHYCFKVCGAMKEEVIFYAVSINHFIFTNKNRTLCVTYCYYPQ